MTYLEKFKQEHPELTDSDVYKEYCPQIEFAMPNEDCWYPGFINWDDCARCWNREYKGEKMVNWYFDDFPSGVPYEEDDPMSPDFDGSLQERELEIELREGVNK